MNLNALEGEALGELGFDWGSLVSAAVNLAPQAINAVAQKQVAKVYAKAGVTGPGYQTNPQAPTTPAAPVQTTLPATQADYLPATQPAGIPNWAKVAAVVAAVVALLLLLRSMGGRRRGNA